MTSLKSLLKKISSSAGLLQTDKCIVMCNVTLWRKTSNSSLQKITRATRKSWQKQKTAHEEEDIQRLTEENIKLQLSSLNISLKFLRFLSEELRCVEVEKAHSLIGSSTQRSRRRRRRVNSGLCLRVIFCAQGCITNVCNIGSLFCSLKNVIKTQ